MASIRSFFLPGRRTKTDPAPPQELAESRGDEVEAALSRPRKCGGPQGRGVHFRDDWLQVSGGMTDAGSSDTKNQGNM